MNNDLVKELVARAELALKESRPVVALEYVIDALKILLKEEEKKP